MTNSPLLRQFDDLDRPVRFSGCPEILDGIAEVLRGWQIREPRGGAEAVAPRIRIRRTTAGYRFTSPRFSVPSECRKEGFRRDATGAVCTFHSELIRWYLEANPSLLCLHCGAVQYGDGLVIFSGPYRAGKSTLTVQLAAAGARMFCDDVLPIEAETNHGVAPGFLPRLRLPLPDGLSPDFTQFLRARPGPANSGNRYVGLGESELAPLGAKAPIKGIIALEREEDATPCLTATGPDEILKRVIMRNIAKEVDVADVLDRLLDIVSNARGFTMRYATGEQAASLIEREFGPPGTAPSAKGPTA